MNMQRDIWGLFEYSQVSFDVGTCTCARTLRLQVYAWYETDRCIRVSERLMYYTAATPIGVCRVSERLMYWGVKKD